MFQFRKSIAVCAALLFFAIAAIAHADDDMIDNPAYQSWAKHKTGTMVKHHTESDSMGNKTSIDTTQTLTDLTPDKATIEVKGSMKMAGNSMDMPAQTQEIPAKIKKPDDAAPAGDAQKPKQGTEDVKIGDKTYSCKWTEVTTDQNGTKTTAKTWTCDDVPGNVVKMEANRSGAMTATVTMALVECDTK
jgi:hypothetical protein